MTKILHIIPAWKDSCRDKQYKRLSVAAKSRGYKVICHNINWNKPLSHQTFTVSRGSVVFGFSLGAIMAWMVAQKSSCKHLILASMTPFYSFKKSKIKRELVNLTGQRFISDIIGNLKTKNKALKQTLIYGDREDERANILVPNTGHRLTVSYIKEVSKILS